MMPGVRWRVLALLAGAIPVGASAGQQPATALLSWEREIALATSAAPPHLAAGAAVYVLERTGYVKAREGTNGFTCLVVREHPADLVPLCHDPEGSRTVLPAVVREAQLRSLGKTAAEIRTDINEGLRTGTFRLPERVGIAYALSSNARAYRPDLRRTIQLRPHLRFYAPFLRGVDIGVQESRPDDAFEYPVVMREGDFNAFIVLNLTDRDAPVPPVTQDHQVLDMLAGRRDGPPLLPRDREVALAESAGPPYVARLATLYVLERGGFVKIRDGSNGFACLVERGQVPGTMYPQCFDREGVETLLPPILRTATLRGQGKSQEEIDRVIAAGFRSGEFRAPRRIGIAYMLSTEGRFEAPTGGLSGWAPHFMIYAPYIRDVDIGAPPGDHTVRRLPTVIQAGPHSYIVVTARRKNQRGSTAGTHDLWRAGGRRP